jgi:hypothetical protein
MPARSTPSAPVARTMLGSGALPRAKTGSQPQDPRQSSSRIALPLADAEPVTPLPEPATPSAAMAAVTHASQPILDPPGVTYARGPSTKQGMAAQSRPPATSSQPIIDPEEILATARRAKRSSHVAIGASIIERQHGSRWWIPVLAAIAVGGGITALVMATRGNNEPTAKEEPEKTKAAPPPAPTTGTVKFVIEPADAEIRIEGQVAHSGSEWSTELAAGKHQIEIHKSGYKSWLTTIELTASETQTFRVVLEPLGTTAPATDATLELTTTPANLDAFLDGKPLAQHTPVKTTLKPGPHVVTVRRNGVEVWHQEVQAQPSAVYEYNPVFPDKKPEPRVVQRPETPERPTRPPDRTAPAIAPHDEHPAVVDTHPVEPPPTPDKPPDKPPPPPDTSKPTVGVPPPPPSVPTPPTPTQPVPVGPGDVQRVSGSPPTLSKGRYADDLPATISVKMCIDTTGRVTTTAVLGKVPRSVADDVVASLRAWVYAPYKKNGVAFPACFVVKLRTGE